MAAQFRDPKESKSQVEAFAVKVLRRLHGLGARSQTIDDVRQELWMAWCKACECYDPTKGASFKTFLHRGMQQHINSHIEKNFERFHEQTTALSIDAQIDAAEGASFGEIIADTRELQDAEVERELMFDYACSRLSDRARIFLTLLKEQPIELVREVRCIEDKAQYAKERGINFAAAHRLTTPMIFDFMGASRSERTVIMNELTQLGDMIANRI